MRYLILLFIVGCASEPLTQEEIEYNAQFELERAEAYAMWANGCINANGIIFTYNPSRPCRNRKVLGARYCVPHRFDWDILTSHNNTVCASRSAIADAFF